jgi:hypothetical protein
VLAIEARHVLQRRWLASFKAAELAFPIGGFGLERLERFDDFFGE